MSSLSCWHLFSRLHVPLAVQLTSMILVAFLHLHIWIVYLVCWSKTTISRYTVMKKAVRIILCLASCTFCYCCRTTQMFASSLACCVYWWSKLLPILAISSFLIYTRGNCVANIYCPHKEFWLYFILYFRHCGCSGA